VSPKAGFVQGEMVIVDGGGITRRKHVRIGTQEDVLQAVRMPVKERPVAVRW